MDSAHYWHFPDTLPDRWSVIRRDAEILTKAFPDPLATLLIDDDQISFNGSPPQGHDMFVLRRAGGGEAFCNTGGLPYDALVCAILSIARMHRLDMAIRSAAPAGNWLAAQYWALRVLPPTIDPGICMTSNSIRRRFQRGLIRSMSG